jgi:tetratricopeptide (TPR) repeat protein
MSPANRQEAQRAFTRALEMDSRSADARIGLATILVSNIADGWSASPEEYRSQSEKLLLEAGERDPNRSMAHYAMAMLRRSQGRLIESKIEFETAITLDRNNARAYFNLGQTLIFLGHPQAAIPHIEKPSGLTPSTRTWHRCIGVWECVTCCLAMRTKRSSYC